MSTAARDTDEEPLEAAGPSTFCSMKMLTPFARLVAALKASKKTIVTAEQCCGGLISSSILEQPGASRVFFGGTTVYSTKRSKPLLMNSAELHESIMKEGPALSLSNVQNDLLAEQTFASTEEEDYVRSKLHWTATTATAFCEEMETDFAVAEGGAAGPTFNKAGMTTGFAAVAVAARNETTGKVSIAAQTIVRSPTNDRKHNMRLFADAAAELALSVVDPEAAAEQENKEEFEPSQALQLDRATHMRSDKAAQEAAAEKAVYVVLRGDKNRILVDTENQLALLSNDQALQLFVGLRHSTTFLGLLGPQQKTPVFGMDVWLSGDENHLSAYSSTVSSYSFADTRTTAPLFSPVDNELALHATALAAWQRRTSFCSLCGGPTEFIDGGTCCQCTVCKTRSWPRQDPSMIVAVGSRDRSQILLAQSPRHPPPVHTALAGFVEAGETFEAAVAREVYEETGVKVDEGSVQYVGSQPWPFPQSCMIGFTATADPEAPLNIDEKEIVSAGWFDRATIAKATTVPGATMQKAVAENAVKNDPSLKLLIPPKGVLARRLIDHWLERSS
jgi:NAD+ diphosphatase